ncbi:MAG: DUF512 domain-containing protein [Eubacterium sp.]|nr:DUF512 domain-containing protein [Eubacterium sp.]
MSKFLIESVAPGSIFEEMEIEAGDFLLSINGQEVSDFMDYRYLIADEYLKVEVEKADGEIWELDIEKDFDEDPGVAFSTEAIETRTCKNKCIFCFIDQMPPGMRETLYVKDDDERLSFLLGNYVTLTNLTQQERERIVRYRIMPINISVHTTNPELRCKMLHNRFAGTILEDLRYFADNHIDMNGQIVLCPGYNDGRELERTLNDLMAFYPAMGSVSVVPVGLSKYREGLCPLEKFDQAGARRTIEIITAVQEKMAAQHGTRFVYPSDEFFLCAGIPLPKSDYYDGFPQIENGVGMMTDFKDSLREALVEHREKKADPQKIGVITGCLASAFMEECCAEIEKAFPQLSFEVMPVVNNFFGRDITVSGLMTGTDIMAQIAPDPAVDLYLLPENAVRRDTEILLDDVTLEDLKDKLKQEIRIVPTEGGALLDHLNLK